MANLSDCGRASLPGGDYPVKREGDDCGAVCGVLAECGVLRKEGHDDGRGGVDLVLEPPALIAAFAEFAAELGEFGVALLFPETGGAGPDVALPFR
ncbi:hypothetical protein GCM10010103_66480 [Streptomyces paradoxus]